MNALVSLIAVIVLAFIAGVGVELVGLHFVFGAVLPYLAMSYLYKRSNLLWHLLIKYRLTATVWRPLVEHARRRHLRFRRELAARGPGNVRQHGTVVSAGV